MAIMGIFSLCATILVILEEYDAKQENITDYRVASWPGQLFGSELELAPENMKISSADIYVDVRIVNFVPMEDYNRMTGKEVILADDEVLVYAF